MSSRFSARPSGLSRSGPVLATALAALAVSLSGCGDDPHFDHAQYQIVVTSGVLRDYASAGSLKQGENWLFEPTADFPAFYEPGFCSGTKTTTPGNGQRTVTIDWHGCAILGQDIVGELEYVGGGAYEGLVSVTFDLEGTTTTIDTWLALEPNALPPAE
jgi:hypothetical protein